MRHTQRHQALQQLLLNLLGSLLAQLAQAVRPSLTLLDGLFHLFLQVTQRVVAVLDVRQLLCQRVALADELLHALAVVFLLQLIQTVQPVVDLVQLCRVEIRIFQHAAHLAGDVLQLDMTAVQPLCQLLRLGQHLADAAQRMACRAHLTYRTAGIVIQRVIRLIECSLDVLGMAHRLALLFQLLLFTLAEAGIGQLLILVLQEVLVLPVALDVVLQLLQLALQQLIGVIRFVVFRQLLTVLRHDVHHAQLEVLLVQQQVLVL